MPDRAHCYFQTVIVSGEDTAHASFDQIRDAASALLSKCTQSSPSEGGIVRDIGKTRLKLFLVERHTEYVYTSSTMLS